LLIAGDGPDREPLCSQRDRLELGGRVSLVGAANEDKIASLYRGALFVVCPSRWEGLPLVCLEAMASTRAVVATNVDGIPDAVIDGETGVLVPSDDPAALADAMAALLEAPERCTELGLEGQRRVRARFTWHQIGRQYTDFFAEVTG
jgi:glycosyltransferase involved in cell wall biosynthesis